MPKVFAQELIIGENFSEVFVEYLSVYTDSSKAKSNTQIVEVYNSNKFSKTKSFGDGIGLGNFNYWMVLDVRNFSKSQTEVVFELPIARLDSFKVFSLHVLGTLTLEASCIGIGANINSKPLRSYGHAVKIALPANSSKSCFLS